MMDNGEMDEKGDTSLVANAVSPAQGDSGDQHDTSSFKGESSVESREQVSVTVDPPVSIRREKDDPPGSELAHRLKMNPRMRKPTEKALSSSLSPLCGKPMAMNDVTARDVKEEPMDEDDRHEEDHSNSDVRKLPPGRRSTRRSIKREVKMEEMDTEENADQNVQITAIKRGRKRALSKVKQEERSDDGVSRRKRKVPDWEPVLPVGKEYTGVRFPSDGSYYVYSTDVIRRDCWLNDREVIVGAQIRVWWVNRKMKYDAVIVGFGKDEEAAWEVNDRHQWAIDGENPDDYDSHWARVKKNEDRKEKRLQAKKVKQEIKEEIKKRMKPGEPQRRSNRVSQPSSSSRNNSRIVASSTVGTSRSTRRPFSSSSTRRQPVVDLVNRPSYVNGLMLKSPEYKKLEKLCRSKWRTSQFFMQNTPDDSVTYHGADVEVETRKKEGWKTWDRQWNEDIMNGVHSYAADYVVGSTERKVGELIGEYTLMKCVDWPIPSWDSTIAIDSMKPDAMTAYRTRCTDLDFIEVRLRLTMGDEQFEKKFPNRYLKYEEGSGAGRYITLPESRYYNDLRAIESKWQYICRRHGLPTLYIEDWTTLPYDDESLKKLEFIIGLANSTQVETLLKDFNDLKDIKCQKKCRMCDKKKRTHGKNATTNHCCGVTEAVDVDSSSSTGEFEWRDKGKTRPLTHFMHYECTDACICDKTKCKNHQLQRGRQNVICIFREDGEKGWGVRAVSKIKDCTFVSEYAGEVDVDGPGDNYDYEMAYSRIDSSGQVHDKLVISAGAKGNEARFFNHHCIGNLTTRTAIIERYGLFYGHVAFFTERDIFPGEALEFDYFNREKDLTRISEMFPNGCLCLSDKCRFPPGSVAPTIEEKTDGDKDDEGEEKESMISAGEDGTSTGDEKQEIGSEKRNN